MMALSNDSRGWLACACSLGQFVIVMGILFGYGEVVVFFARQFDTSMTVIECVGATSVFFPMAAAPLAIYLNGILGTMKTVMMGVVVSSLGLLCTALSTSIYVILVTLGFAFGIGATLILNPPFLLLDEYFPIDHPRHAFATSIGTCSYPLGVLFFNPLMYALLQRFNWKITYGILSGLLFVFGMLSSLSFIKPSETDRQTNTESSTNRTIRQKEQYSDLDNKNQKDLSLHAKLLLGGLWFCASTLKAVGYYTPFLILVKHMDSLGIPQSKASSMMTVIALGELTMRIVTSFLGDYVKGKLLFVYTVFCTALSVVNFLGAYAKTYETILGFGLVLGISGGPIIAVLFTASAEVFAGKHVSAVFSIARLGFGFGCLLGPIMAGVIFDSAGSYSLVFLVNGGAYLVTALIYLSIIIINNKQPWFFWEPSKTGSEAELIIPKSDNQPEQNRIEHAENGINH